MNCPYLPFNNFLLRTPFFSFEKIEQFNLYLKSNIFKEMLFAASTDLCESIEKENYNKKALYASYRYFQRACTRATPFGLFAGCSTGEIGKSTQVELVRQDKYIRKSRLDMYLVCELTQIMECNDNIRHCLKYFPNTSIYRVGEFMRYVEYYFQNGRRVYQISQVQRTTFLQKIVEASQRGALFDELVNILILNGIEECESTEYVNQMINNQILVSELEISVTNTSPLLRLIHKLEKLKNANIESFIDTLKKMDTLLKEIDKKGIRSTNNEYFELLQNIHYFNSDVQNKYIFQTDLFKPTIKSTISVDIIRDIQQSIVFLNKITPLTSNGLLEKFKENFNKRYEEQEVSLLNVLDNELGIGYGESFDGNICPLIDDLVLPRNNLPINTALSPFQCILYKKYQKALQNGNSSIELIDIDADNGEISWNDLPPTMSVICQIIQDFSGKRLIYIKSIGGSSAANLLGRFCHLDPNI